MLQTLPQLLVIPPLSMHRAPSGKLVLTRKFLDGLAAYAHYFPGKVTALLAIDQTPTTDLDHIEFDPTEYPFKIEILPPEEGDLTRLLKQADIVLGSLCFDFDVRLTELCNQLNVPIVLVTEYSLQTRRQIIHVTVPNPLKRMKRAWAAGRLEEQFRHAIEISSGVQCNGTPTFDDYNALNLRTLLFFDTRVRESMLPPLKRVEERIAHMLAGYPLRLVFSGRLIAMKGADHLPRVAYELKRRKIPFSFDICGDGDLADAITDDLRELSLAECVHMRGNLTFASELVPLVTDACDLFIQCHPQGDPSCTYLETMACATPIAGYDNAAFQGIVKTSGVGFATPMNNAAALADQIARLHANRTKLADAAMRSFEFANRHTFENTMQMRVAHLLDCMNATHPRAPAESEEAAAR